MRKFIHFFFVAPQKTKERSSCTCDVCKYWAQIKLGSISVKPKASENMCLPPPSEAERSAHASH